ncbi:MAG TPA: tetratricopeptide repeat protein [Candidatus Binataceae bacterium]|nr:tetratricopeptide repeat protein [Candidatus Binataceae bacterium]
MTNSLGRVILVPLVALIACSAAACLQAAIDQNKSLIEQQQAQLQQMQQDIAALRAQQSPSAAPVPPGQCDAGVMAKATRSGGEKFAANDFAKALGYYQDALAACPGNPRAELNVARAYEASGNRADAIEHYQRAAASGDPSEHDAEEQARAALTRLGGRSN